MADKYVATFHTHLSAQLSLRGLKRAGIAARLAPTPREVSSSCGVCVRYESGSDCSGYMDEDLDAIFLLTEEGYREILRRK